MLSSEPAIVTVGPLIAAPVSTGKFCNPFAPASPSNTPKSFGVGPSSARSIAMPVLPLMTLPRIATPVAAPVTITPSPPLKAMRLPAPAAVPPIPLLDDATSTPDSELPTPLAPAAVVPM